MLRYILLAVLCGCSQQSTTMTVDEADAILYRATLKQRDAILRGESPPCCADAVMRRRAASAPVNN